MFETKNINEGNFFLFNMRKILRFKIAQNND